MGSESNTGMPPGGTIADRYRGTPASAAFVSNAVAIEVASNTRIVLFILSFHPS